jgi:hypothetical protein
MYCSCIRKRQAVSATQKEEGWSALKAERWGVGAKKDESKKKHGFFLVILSTVPPPRSIV